MGDLPAMEEQRWPTLEETFDIETFETIAESASAYVTRAQWWDTGKCPVVIKSGSIDQRFSKQPHDIGKELRILSSLSNTNIIGVLGHTFESPTSTLHYWMPWIPFHLSDILSSPYLVPHTPPGSGKNKPGTSSFEIVMKSLVYQTLTALAYIHEREIAHRDVKPRNLLLTQDGCIKLADFGVAWSEQQNVRDLWPEPRGRMCFDVASGPYRAPELLFGTAEYNACAIDLWSMGAVLAEFFTPLRLRRTYEYEDDWYQDYADAVDSDFDECPVKPPFVVPKGLSPDQRDVEWTRESLYDASRGQIGLAWSIFKVHGTPTEETWPMFKQLPDAQKVTFMQVPPVDLSTLLPNLPPKTFERERENCLDLARNFLTYPPDQRMRATDALQHRLFSDGLPLLFPPGYPDGHGRDTWDGRGLADILSQYLGNAV